MTEPDVPWLAVNDVSRIFAAGMVAVPRKL
jgi:hypothetical protein